MQSLGSWMTNRCAGRTSAFRTRAQRSFHGTRKRTHDLESSASSTALATATAATARRHHRRIVAAATRRHGKVRWKSTSSPPPPVAEHIPEPSFRDIRLVAIAQAIPFIGFGFMDNAILIIAGDAIDTSLGIYLGISTLCAAAIGNIISDLAGIGLGTMIEDFCANVLKLPVPNITAAQRTLRSVRTASNLGMALGMTFGCILGMFPLWFIDTSRVEQMKKNAHLEALFQDVVTEAKTLIGAESTCLYLRVHIDDKDSGSNKSEGSNSKWQGVNSGKSGRFLFSASENHQIRPAVDGEHLYAMYYVVPGSSKAKTALPAITAKTSTDEKKGKAASAASTADKDSFVPAGVDGSRIIPIGKGIVSRAVLTGEAWNIADVRKEPDFLPDLYENDGSIPRNLRHIVVVPVLDGQGQVIAVIRAFNKKPKSSRQPSRLEAWTGVGGIGEGIAGAPVLRPGGFTDADVQILKSLASHISVSLQSVFRDEEHEEMRLRDTIRILKEHGLEGIADPSRQKANGRRRPSLFPNQ